MFSTLAGINRIFGAGLLLLLAACSTAGGQIANGGPDRSDVVTSRSPEFISSEELAGASHLNALQAVQRLRPRWLRSRGPVSTATPAVGPGLFVDGNPRGYGLDLATIPVVDVLEMRFLDSRAATTRFGTGYPDGAILIATRRG